jgi:hypothetical protein
MEEWLAPALIAAIVSGIVNIIGWFVTDRIGFRRDAQERYARDPNYSIIVPHTARNLVFESLLGELQIVPGEIIEPLIHYEKMREIIERFVADLRGELFRHSPADRQLLMYSNYLRMLDRREQLAHNAISALEISLSSQDADRSSPTSAPATDEAAASQQGDP